MRCRLTDAAAVIHPVVGCLDTQNWVHAGRLRGPGALQQRGCMAAETAELGAICLVGSTQMATSVGMRWDQMREQSSLRCAVKSCDVV